MLFDLCGQARSEVWSLECPSVGLQSSGYLPTTHIFTAVVLFGVQDRLVPRKDDFCDFYTMALSPKLTADKQVSEALLCSPLCFAFIHQWLWRQPN